MQLDRKRSIQKHSSGMDNFTRWPKCQSLSCNDALRVVIPAPDTRRWPRQDLGEIDHRRSQAFVRCNVCYLDQPLVSTVNWIISRNPYRQSSLFHVRCLLPWLRYSPVSDLDEESNSSADNVFRLGFDRATIWPLHAHKWPFSYSVSLTDDIW